MTQKLLAKVLIDGSEVCAGDSIKAGMVGEVISCDNYNKLALVVFKKLPLDSAGEDWSGTPWVFRMDRLELFHGDPDTINNKPQLSKELADLLDELEKSWDQMLALGSKLEEDHPDATYFMQDFATFTHLLHHTREVGLDVLESLIELEEEDF
jgi:hypothetical protein